MSRILVVEDSRTQAEALRCVLEAAGFDVAVAPDGERGLALFHASPFDLVLTDVLMPGLSGYDLCRRIKGDPARRQTPVVLLTSLGEPVDIIEGIACGADHFIRKPYEPDHLVARIRGLFENKALRAQPRLKTGVEVVFLGKTFTITSDKEQILDLLLSTCEEIIHSNQALRASQEELRQAKDRVERDNGRLQGRVRLSEEKYRGLMERANDAILLMDPRGVVLEVNRRAEDLLGRPRADLVGRPYQEFVPPEDGTRARERFRTLLAVGSIRTDDARFRRADGRTVSIDLSASVVEDGGERVVLAIARDATERNQLERQLRQAQKMEAVGQLAGGVAHDFNNLLQVITGYGELLLGNLRHDDPSRELVGEMTKAGERAAGLTRQLLAFSRQSILAPCVLDVNAVVADVEKMLRRVIGEDVELATALCPELGRVKADPGQIEQILMNLAVNARDAMPRGGRLTIETENVDLDDEYARLVAGVRPGPYVLVSVRDTGQGMTAEVQARIFEPFFTTKEPGKGTGLGLSTVFGIVRQGGGHVAVQTEPGAGACFKVYLPRVAAAATTPKPRPHEAPASGGGETVLLVEDEEAVRSLTRIVLQGAGYHLLEAADGAQALEIAGRHGEPIHLLLSDVVMPVLGGRQLAERLLALHPEMRVLFQSGYMDDAVVRHGVLQERVNFLQKPFTPAALARKVREVLDSPRETDKLRAGPRDSAAIPRLP